jgi:anti-sigma factor ChrR (cupin superfamily)
MNQTINGDPSVRVVVDSCALEWTPSPSGTVWRKRLHLVGPAESGQVTSVVRYDANSAFPPHDHPGGEEILVLDGIFSDEHGDWPAGTYLLNPEGFRHAPFSKNGCLIFVKLRQFPGREREHVVRNTAAMAWQQIASDGTSVKLLYQQAGFADTVRLERWPPGSQWRARTYAGGAELFVIEGSFADEQGRYTAGAWLRFPIGAGHRVSSAAGCVLYVKEGAISLLNSGVS